MGVAMCLDTGCAHAPDEGSTPKFSVKVEHGVVHLNVDELKHLAVDPADQSA